MHAYILSFGGYDSDGGAIRTIYEYRVAEDDFVLVAGAETADSNPAKFMAVYN